MFAIGNFLGGSVMLLLGLLMRVFKMSNLIAGYNTSTKEEKAKYDEKKLTKFVGNMLIVASIILLLGGLIAEITNVSVLTITVSWLLFLLTIIVGVIYMNTGNHFRH